MNMQPPQADTSPPSIQDDPEAMQAIQLLMQRGFAQQACQMLSQDNENEEAAPDDESAEGAVDGYLARKSAPPHDDGD